MRPLRAWRLGYAFAERSLHKRIELLDSLLAQLSADDVRVAVNDPESLGLVAEARLIGLPRSDELARYLPASEVRRRGRSLVKRCWRDYPFEGLDFPSSARISLRPPSGGAISTIDIIREIKVITKQHYVQAARSIKHKLGTKAFDGLQRSDLTQLLREISGEDATRLASQMCVDLENALLHQGVRCFPHISELANANDSVRVFHAGSLLGNLVDALRYPGPDTNRELAVFINKVKGRWNFGQAEVE